MIRSSCILASIAFTFGICQVGWTQSNLSNKQSPATRTAASKFHWQSSEPSCAEADPTEVTTDDSVFNEFVLSPEVIKQISYEPSSEDTLDEPVENTASSASQGRSPTMLDDFQPCRDWQLRHSGCDSCEDLLGGHRSAWQMGGWLQQGFTFNPDDPANGLNAPVLFNDQANEYQLNQFYLYAGREVRLDGQNWDWGGRIDLNYGTDSRFVTVPGLERHDDRTRKWNSETSDYGFALPQAYVEMGTPLGPYGSVIRAGHFYALSGYESFAAPEKFFYSRAYSFLYGQPFTHTGAIMSGKVTETSAISLGVTTGWDAFYDEVDQWGIRYAFQKLFNNGKTVFSITGHTGEENTGVKDQSGNRRASRNWINLILKQQVHDQLYYVLQGDYGIQDSAVVVLDNANNSVGFEDASWYGISQYLVYQMSSQWSSGLRVEWFRDDGQSRLGLPISYTTGGDAFDGGNYFAITGGLNYQPHKNVMLRSELRWDTSDTESNPAIPFGVAGIQRFDDGNDDNQILIGLDAIVSF